MICNGNPLVNMFTCLSEHLYCGHNIWSSRQFCMKTWYGRMLYIIDFSTKFVIFFLLIAFNNTFILCSLPKLLVHAWTNSPVPLFDLHFWVTYFRVVLNGVDYIRSRGCAGDALIIQSCLKYIFFKMFLPHNWELKLKPASPCLQWSLSFQIATVSIPLVNNLL